jgi:tRNA dimethylallyltransferase
MSTETALAAPPFASRIASQPAMRVGFVVGPTGVGKSAFALEIAERLEAEIVNADSRQVYCGMDIGTAKPTLDERRRVPHHLIDIRKPHDPLDVASFLALARTAIADVAARGSRAIVVGGSGLYLRVLRGGIFEGPTASIEIRDELIAVAHEKGTSHLHEQLRQVDAVAAKRISPNDLKRIIRALEVYRLTGTPISVHQQRHRFSAGGFESLIIGLEMPREQLYDAIDRRFDAMMAAGLVDEVRALVTAGYRVDAQPLCTIGYREIAAYLRGATSLAEAVERAKRESRRLAKRQLTWFRSEPGIEWLDPSAGVEPAIKLFDDFFSSERVRSDG